MKRGVKPLKILIFLLTAALLFAFGAIGYGRIMKMIYPLEYSEYVEKFAEKYNVPESFVYAVIYCESGFDPNAHSNADAKGLMQIQDDTFDWARSKADDASEGEDIYDSQVNIKYGTLLLSLHLQEFESKELALAAYHSGRSQVNEWLNNKEHSSDGKTIPTIPAKGTAHYVDKVLKAEKMYKRLYDF